MFNLSTKAKKIEPNIYILFVIFFIYNSILYLYIGNFLISSKLIRFSTLGLLIYFVWREKGNTLLKFLSLFLFYLSFTNPVPSSDLVPSRFLPLWFDTSLNFKFEMLLDLDSSTILKKEDLISLQGQMISLPHPVENGYLVLPYYLVPGSKGILPTYSWTPGFLNFLVYKTFSFFHPLIISFDETNSKSILQILPVIYRLESFSAAIIATVTSYLLYLILCLKPFSNTKSISFFLVLIYSLCTSHFSNSSQGLWQHTIIEFLLGVILYLVFLENNNHIRLLFIGFFTAVLFYSRPSSVFLLTFPAIYFIQKFKDYKWSLLSGMVSFSLTLIFFGCLNNIYYGHYLGGYSLHKISYSIIGYSDLFSNSFWEGFFGLTLSPGFGYYFFSPFLLLPIFYLSKIPNKTLLFVLFVPEVLLLIFYAKYIFWEGGDSYGARFLTDVNIYSVLAFALIPIEVWRKKIHQFFVIILLGFSFYIQYFGANQKEIISLWNNCDYEDSLEKSIDLKNLPFHPKKELKSCEKKKAPKKINQNTTQ